MPHKNSESIGKSLHSDGLPHKEIEHKEIDPEGLKQGLGRITRARPLTEEEKTSLKIKKQILDMGKSFTLKSNSTPFSPAPDKPIVVIKEMQDITAPETVEIQIRSDAKTIWINIDGICRLRACRIKNLVLIDEHSKRTIVYPTNETST